MKSTDVLAILQEFYRERLTMRERHVAVARHVSNYEFNNTYQYIIAREDTQLSWLEAAIREMDGTADVVPPLTLAAPGRREGFLGLVAEDARTAQAFVDQWRPRMADVTQARHRGMMQVVIGETLEHKRFFDQMAAGRDDLLGKRTGGPRTGDGVMPGRWAF